MIAAHRVAALFGITVALIAGLPSVFASIYNLNTGWRKMTEATAGAQA
jgi:hypothetical protein